MTRLKKVKKKVALPRKKRKVKRMKKIELVSAVLNVDISSFGDTKAAALASLKEALELYLEDAPVSGVVKIQKPGIQTQTFMHA
jgi:3-hydroxyisobutyrate dehydrogenase-like beta-hydroxyacid dehydrogenase